MRTACAPVGATPAFTQSAEKKDNAGLETRAPSRKGNGMKGEALAPGDWVANPRAPEWGAGQVQSVIGERVTVNFENAGKRLIDAAEVRLERVEPPRPPGAPA